MKTAIVTDSNSGIFEAEARELGIYVIPMPVILEDHTYFEGLDLTHEEFFGKLAAKASVHTSSPETGSVTDLWDRLLKEEGYDDIVHMPMSSGLSGTCEIAKMLAADYDGKVQVVDNHRISVTLRHAVHDALILRDQGLDAAAIRKKLDEMGPQSIIYLGVSTLDYFRASGRVTPATAAIGNVLNLKPLLYTDGERFDTVVKVRGVAKCQKKLIEAIGAKVKEYTADGTKIRIGVASSFANQADTDAWVRVAQGAFPEYEVRYDPLTFSISCHTGPDAFGMGISKIL